MRDGAMFEEQGLGKERWSLRASIESVGFTASKLVPFPFDRLGDFFCRLEALALPHSCELRSLDSRGRASPRDLSSS